MPRTSVLAPLVAAVLIALLTGYLGAYAALVVPQGVPIMIPDRCGPYRGLRTYRCDWQRAEQVFWPLEQLDRRVRPEAWRRDL